MVHNVKIPLQIWDGLPWNILDICGPGRLNPADFVDPLPQPFESVIDNYPVKYLKMH